MANYFLAGQTVYLNVSEGCNAAERQPKPAQKDSVSNFDLEGQIRHNVCAFSLGHTLCIFISLSHPPVEKKRSCCL